MVELRAFNVCNSKKDAYLHDLAWDMPVRQLVCQTASTPGLKIVLLEKIFLNISIIYPQRRQIGPFKRSRFVQVIGPWFGAAYGKHGPVFQLFAGHFKVQYRLQVLICQIGLQPL